MTATDTTIVDVVPVEKISERARELRPGRVAQSVIGGLLFALGWLVMNTLRGAWWVISWCLAGFLTGWDSAAHRQPRRSRGDLEAEVEQLRAMVTRLGG